MYAERSHSPAVSGDTLTAIQRPEFRQQIPSAREHRCGWYVQPGQLRYIASAPARQLERQGHKIGLHNLRRCKRRKAALRTLTPQRVAHARLESARSALALIG